MSLVVIWALLFHLWETVSFISAELLLRVAFALRTGLTMNIKINKYVYIAMTLQEIIKEKKHLSLET